MSGMNQTESKSFYDRIPWWVIGLVFVFAAGAFVAAKVLSDDGPAIGTEREAKSACHEFVKNRLKSPSTAEFGGELATGPGPIWTVDGDVDSQNSFGASVRNHFVCKADYADGVNWRLVDLQMTGN